MFEVPYGEGELDRMDLYVPAGGEPAGLLIFVHGGSWVGGDKGKLTKAPGLIGWCMERDLALAAPNFRLASRPPSQEVTWRGQLQDLARALAWLEVNGSDHALDSETVVLMGFSSGAHLAALLGTDPQWLGAEGLGLDHLDGVISLDVHVYDLPLALELMPGSEVERNIPKIEWLFGTDPAEQLAASPTTWLDYGPLPPALVISADPDHPGSKGRVARLASEHYAQARRDAGHYTTIKHFDEQSHSGLVLDFGSEGHGPTEAVEGFMEEVGRTVER